MAKLKDKYTKVMGRLLFGDEYPKRKFYRSLMPHEKVIININGGEYKAEVISTEVSSKGDGWEEYKFNLRGLENCPSGNFDIEVVNRIT